MPLLKFNFAKIYIIHKILALFKNHVNYRKDNVFENRRPKEEQISKDIKNLSRLKKATKLHCN